MSRENIIKSAYLQFHTATPTTTSVPSPFPNNPEFTFGIMQLKIADTPMITQNQVLDTSNDISGSMAEYCSDGSSKMNHAIHTLKNIITSIANNTAASVTMATYGFDDKIETIFEDTLITKDNVVELRNKLGNLLPRNNTDLYQSLETQKERAEQRRAINPTIKQTNITLTDGQTNAGTSTDYSDISKQVPENCTNIFIGFGGDHNAIGLQQLADAQPNGSYFYVAEIEKAGLVFGEVLHALYYTALTDITIELTNAEIYDYKTNTWTTRLFVPSIVSEATKTYHIRSATPDQACATISACSAIHDETEPTLIEDDVMPIPALRQQDNSFILIDLSVYMLRQRTQELMYNAHKHSIETPDNQEQGQIIKNDMRNHLKFMKTYAKENGMESDDILTALIGDMMVILKTFGGRRAAMYTAVRSGSQGRQTSNTVNYISPEDIVGARGGGGGGGAPRPLRRQNAVNYFPRRNNGYAEDEEDEDEEEEEEKECDDEYISSSILPPQLSRTNTTTKQIAIMREISSGGGYIAELDYSALDYPPLPTPPPPPPVPVEEVESDTI